MIRHALVAAAAAVLPSFAFSEPRPFELSDGLLESAVHESERKLERVGFERNQLEERRSFLRALKALPPAERADAWRRFRDAQKQAERRFLENVEQKTERVVVKGDA